MEEIFGLPTLPRRSRKSHKGDFGRILIVGGSRGMIGAVGLTGNSAFRSGAGLVTLAVPRSIQIAVASLSPCATSIPLDETNDGCISSEAVSVLVNLIRAFDVVAIGPGLGNAENIPQLIRELAANKIPIVVDADGLNRLAETDWEGCCSENCVITPHPGELGRLLKCSVEQIQSERKASAAEAVRKMGRGVCVLKGYETIITDGVRIYVNATGNPGMAAGGSGDVLTGVIAALIGQGLDCFDASVLGVYVHGLAGDLAADKFGEVSMMASDIIDYLPQGFEQ